MQPKKLFFLDARQQPDLVQARTMRARRIVFDALDVVLSLLPDAAARRREVYHLHEWLLTRELTGLITAKDGGDEASPATHQQPFGFMQFMVDCAVVLNRRLVMGVSQRNRRVQKYRGSSFDENESPFLLGSSGVERFDTMLGGSCYRGATVLITGVPGTAKTRLSGTGAMSAPCSSASIPTRPS